jgi:hypothetical protein
MGHIKQNRFRGSMAEYGAITALFEDIPASEVSVTSGAQLAFDAARAFIKEMIANQCRLAGCKLTGHPHGEGDEHTNKCWFGMRQAYYADRNAKKLLREAEDRMKMHVKGFGGFEFE